MPKKLIEWYGEYRQLKDGRQIQHDYAQAIAHKLNSDYSQLGYDYAFGVVKNKPKYIHFGCEETACLHKSEKDFVVWVLRTKPCLNSPSKKTF
uniref:Uncharacterized protein n=1 Tax=Panagrolaimus sp. ES5 TaxID=591445 RepID=A0AC34G732_9BILA